MKNTMVGEVKEDRESGKGGGQEDRKGRRVRKRGQVRGRERAKFEICDVSLGSSFI